MTPQKPLLSLAPYTPAVELYSLGLSFTRATAAWWFQGMELDGFSQKCQFFVNSIMRLSSSHRLKSAKYVLIPHLPGEGC